MAGKKTKTPESFGAARERLDAILDELENDTADVDRLAERVREASALIRFCRERLAATRAEVTTVVAELAAEEKAAASEAAADRASASAPSPSPSPAPAPAPAERRAAGPREGAPADIDDDRPPDIPPPDLMEDAGGSITTDDLPF